ncbi:MAG: hypothetical protein A2675_03440 [Candidatus Yonathbacteria bacterium RIFCSPHIGHO2_01_FULL_51_10]|uniref:Glucosamine/galactosamine-6-phosphate isomerase domain-containing protein n=1 Tax=Candidatus Yonathbacteria bacterium RIFCSPHIGHO2_01_FULL_51_10 TaxID=1802723 RepID=A0A1G2S8U3_9BACT|nr:MAG: hypothetical protein A2675_03440 [Candidatus Yonathbacteria bacterium RIFCSPHIGHO2_01_FULL_51_10]
MELATSARTDAATFLAGDLSRMLMDYQKRAIPTLLFLSGGSALTALDGITPESLSGLITITTLDERYDPTGRNANFVALSKAPFFRRAEMRGVQIVDTCVLVGESQTELADRMESEVRAWKTQYPQGVCIAIAGVGAEGHIAGMMPYPENPPRFAELFEGERWFIGYDAKNKNEFPLRVTATMTFLRKLTHVFAYIQQKGKEAAIEKMKTPGPLAECPARVLQEIPGALYLQT